MMSIMKNRLDDVVIAVELQYSLVYALNTTISDINDILSVDNGASRNMPTQD